MLKIIESRNKRNWGKAKSQKPKAKSKSSIKRKSVSALKLRAGLMKGKNNFCLLLRNNGAEPLSAFVLRQLSGGIRLHYV